ncbi:EAL domain-containing protein [Methylomonas sp. SURF-2]|uniref:EAL domain-containing protein n=1 Tax=Methylomonas subterranea TaxID=2952225 RepID=A0ABT1TAY8_9GAMM|nr:bifunctional diguanylate cyclase/phosphodiesterase [Methylomonas sp. SURF-2]MCQ8102606.1 EAL domain-containing protein [Methylomonas sp. SURF-2]
MAAWLEALLNSSKNFMPHGACYLWQPSVLWLHVISDTLIVLSYYSIPFALAYFAYKRTDLIYRWMFVLFGAFILLCGTTHLLSIWTIWHPDYWLEGWVKLLTAMVSVAAAVLAWPLIPKLLKLPSPFALKASESYMRAIFDATPDAMLITNQGGIITMVNHQCESLLGYRAEELIGRSIEILVPESLRIKHVGLREAFAANPSVKSMGAGRVVKAQKKDGTVFDVEISLSPIRTGKGLFFASAMRDITQRKIMEDVLRASEERFRRMSDASPAMIWITDVNGKPSFVNQTWLDFVGIAFDQAISYENWIQFIHPDDRDSVFAEYYKNVFDQKPIVTEYRMRRARGDWRWILDHGVPIHDENGAFAGYIGSAFDITERKQAEAEFRIAATAFESQEAMVITDVNAVILRVNKTFTESTGYSAEEAVGQNISILKSGRHERDFYADMWHSLTTTGTWQGEIWDKRKNGQIYPKWLTITAVKDETGAVTHYVGTHIDISDRKAAEDEIKNLAFYDPLTQLPNRRLLLDRLQQALAAHARKQQFGALLFLDLDNFKNLNDSLGHEKGDQLLQQVASRLSSCVREYDTVARLGGDEFVVMLKELGGKSAEAAIQAEIIGDKILQSLNQVYLFEGYEHRSTASIGVTLFNDQSLGIDELLKQADIAMYQAKAAGRNNMRFFDPAMQASIVARAALEQALREALESRQFKVFYQPQVDAGGRIHGAEALLRWEHGKHGMVAPASFIPLAEETGLILPIGLYVLESTCQQLVKWSGQPGMEHLTIAVNVSIRQFRQEDFARQVLAVLAETGANPARLKLELTESILALDLQDIKAKMTSLKSRGVRFSLDDFGTGYSSLAYLKQLPLDQLKIDQGFVSDILVDANDEAIAKMIIALAASMGLEVIAEGVETVMQEQKLLHLGCRNYQGYLYGKPLPVDQFEALIRRR